MSGDNDCESEVSWYFGRTGRGGSTGDTAKKDTGDGAAGGLDAPGVVKRFVDDIVATSSELLRFNDGWWDVGSNAGLAESGERIEPTIHVHV